MYEINTIATKLILHGLILDNMLTILLISIKPYKKADLFAIKGLLSCIIHLNLHCGTLAVHPLNLLMHQLAFQTLLVRLLEGLPHFAQALLALQL